MNCSVCPVWLGRFLANPIRKAAHPPDEVIGPHIRRGMTVMDVGCAMGYFTIPAARMVGERGRVIGVDLQPGMLEGLRKRAKRMGLSDRIETRLCATDTLRLEAVKGRVDFALAFAMIHETQDPQKLIREITLCLKPDGRFLAAEPKAHVGKDAFAETIRIAEASGLRLISEPMIRWSRSALFEVCLRA